MKDQEKYFDRKEAVKHAKKLAQQHEYVVVIFSNEAYYIQFEADLIRSWEVVIAEFYKGEKVKL